jgi:hypothetical protein
MTDIAVTATAAVKDSSKDIVATIEWKSVTSILSAAFRIVPKIQEAAKDIPGQRRFDILVSVLEDGLIAWGESDTANKETVDGLRTNLRDILAPSVTAMINAVNSGDVALGVQAAIGVLAATTASAQSIKCTGWKCGGSAAAPQPQSTSS